MAKSREINMNLPSADDLFTTQEERDQKNQEHVKNISIYEITDFPNHPFKVKMDDKMLETIDSVRDHGVLVPALVREKPTGGYEMISGHRRKMASELAGFENMPCIVRNLSDDEAVIVMVDSNLQREEILPSEKAFAYRMKMEALSHQGKKETSRQVGEKLASADMIGKDNGESGRQVQRYIRLTELIQELLDMVDIGKISFSPAVEISYLTKEEQNLLYCYIQKYDATPSQSQAIYLKKLSQEGKLTTNKLEEIMSAEKPNQKPKYNIHYDRFEKYLPRDVVTEKEVEDFLLKCVEEHHRRVKQRQMVR